MSNEPVALMVYTQDGQSCYVTDNPADISPTQRALPLYTDPVPTATNPAITHCDNCGCDWLDNGLNPVGCPYCKQPADAKILVAERDALKAENERLRGALEEIRNRSWTGVMRSNKFELEVALANICLFVDAVLWR